MSKICLSVTLFFIFSFCTEKNKFAEEKKIPNNFQFVISQNGIILREKPGRLYNKLEAIPFNKRVEIIGETDISETILGKNGKWYRIIYDGKEGYVFSPFLRSESLFKNFNSNKSAYFKLDFSSECKNEEVEINCFGMNIYDKSDKFLHRINHLNKGYWENESQVAFELEGGDGNYFYSKSIFNLKTKTEKFQYSEWGDINQNGPDYINYGLCFENNNCIEEQIFLDKNLIMFVKIHDDPNLNKNTEIFEEHLIFPPGIDSSEKKAEYIFKNNIGLDRDNSIKSGKIFFIKLNKTSVEIYPNGEFKKI